jgi:hypothetical protein
MAKDKTSFVLYSDSKSIIDLMTNEQAGLLLKTLFAYVNDENPAIDNSIAIVFEMIKLQLKRDLKKWEKTKEGRSIAGKASAEAKKLAKLKEQNSTNSTNVDFVQQTSTNSTVSDSVNVSVSVSGNVNEIKENNITALPFSFYNSMIKYGFNKDLVSDWLKVRKTKKATNSEPAFKSFIKEVEKTNADINDILTECIIKSWSGFKSEWYKKDLMLNSTEKKKYEVSNAFGKEVVFLTDSEFIEKSKQNFNTYKLLK